MNLTSPTIIKELLGKHGLRPLKRLGQNFLVDQEAVERITEAAGLKPTDIALEIGPGVGAITQELAKKAKKVVAVEKDYKMVEVLEETLLNSENVEVIRGDILKLDVAPYSNYKVIGNLPFYITAPVIRRFLELAQAKPLFMVLVVQKEVGQRICAKPPKMSILGNAVQFYGTPEILFYISKKSFWPQPEVNAAVIKITPRPRLMRDSQTFFKIMKAGFLQPRKQLINNLSKGLKIDKKKVETWLLKNNIAPHQRAETLELTDWLNLTRDFVV